MIGIALTEKLADTTESASETASEIVQDAEQKAGFLRQYMTDLLDWCMSKVGSLVVSVIFMVIGFTVCHPYSDEFYNIDNSGIHCRFSGYFICYIAWNGGCDDRSCVAGQPVQSCRWCADPDIETISCR